METRLEKIYEILMKIFSVISRVSEKFQLPEPDMGKRPLYEVPRMVAITDVKFKKRGRYRNPKGKAEGLIVHYTVSGRTPRSAIAVMKYLASKGLGCMVMDEAGTIYYPEDFDIERDVAYHAGSSKHGSKTGMSLHCMGMEICNWGKLDGRTIKFADDTKLFKNKKDNITPGTYELYTPAQMEALENFIMWQLDVNENFSLDMVLGHDEVAGHRGKTDPGGSLGMTMPEFRERLRENLQTVLG